jgi:hypothetical protein
MQEYLINNFHTAGQTGIFEELLPDSAIQNRFFFLSVMLNVVKD